jgi:putative hydrolase
LLADQRASEFRVRAYHSAAETVRSLNRPLQDILETEGLDGLIALPTIGISIANLIKQSLQLGRMPLLDRLRGEASAEHHFTTLPGIGPELSHRIHEYLHVETLPELYAAARQGRLDQVPGIGRKRAHAILESLSQRITNRNEELRSPLSEPDRSVPISEILSIDEEYRHLASQGKLPKIAPKKFNPGNVAWLPILHTQRGGRQYSALFSNTARAHELNTTRDWVVIYRDDVSSHGCWTVITSQFGRLHGCRLVRGREDECLEYYEQMKQSVPAISQECPNT